MIENDRKARHERNPEVESVLAKLTEIIQVPSGVESDKLPVSKNPNVYIVGCARSGTTLLHQLLVSVLNVTYPTNLISRFSYATYTGALIQKLFTDLDTRKELLGNIDHGEFKSFLGKTQGALSPHEFWYYWRNCFDIESSGHIVEPNAENLKCFRSGLNAIKHVFDKPIILKGMIANNTISSLIEPYSDDKVIWMKRGIEANALSILNARKEFYGDINKWYSFRPETIDEIKCQRLSPHEQVVLQVVETNRMIEKQIKLINPKNVFVIDYENLENNFNHLATLLSDHLDVELNPINLNQVKINVRKPTQSKDASKINEANIRITKT